LAGRDTLDALREAAYNPRSITTKALKQLADSYQRYGDLSGIVFNRKTGNLISGHQRRKVFLKRGTKIVRQAHRDNVGTIAIGHVIAPNDKGGKIRIPYREVYWDGDTEAAANIAANSAGGEFDPVKLGKVLRRLEHNRFPIEQIPLDSTDLKHSIRLFESYMRNSRDADANGFAPLDIGEIRDSLEHCCPRCGYQWSGSSAPPKKPRFSSKKYHEEKRREREAKAAKTAAKAPARPAPKSRATKRRAAPARKAAPAKRPAKRR
jgi:hypothetical protein